MNLVTSLSQVVRHSLLASLAVACARPSPSQSADSVPLLIERSRDSNVSLMKGDAERYLSLIATAPDFTLMSPFGGEPSRGIPTREKSERLGKFFRNGTFEQEVVQAYGSADMVVLALIERATVEVGGLPSQPWALRVTLVYRREGESWRMVHRHADPLVAGISLPEAAELARRAPPSAK